MRYGRRVRRRNTTYRKRYSRRKRTVSRYRRRRMGYSIRGPLKKSRNGLLHMHRAGSLTTVLVTGGTNLVSVASFKLADVYSTADFSNLFEYYRINCVVLKFYPVQDSNDMANYPTFINPIMAFYVDYDDATVPSSVDALYEYGGTKDFVFNKAVSFKIFPKTIALGVGGASNAAIVNTYRKQWFRTNQLDVPYYAFKWALYSFGATQNYAVRIRLHYYFTLKATA